jgi:hypothetical protein
VKIHAQAELDERNFDLVSMCFFFVGRGSKNALWSIFRRHSLLLIKTKKEVMIFMKMIIFIILKVLCGTVLNFWTASTANMMSVTNTIHMTA